MIATLRAMAWLRWRILINAFRRGERRDILERLSRAAEHLVPIAVGALFVIPALGLGVLGMFAGSSVTSGSTPATPVPFAIVGVLLGVMTIAVILAPLLFAARIQTSGMIRFLLLPIPPRLLYASQTLAQLADPWVGVFVPILLLLPLGMIPSAGVARALIALAAGCLLLFVILGLGSLWSSLMALLLRDRRRGETLTLLLWWTMSLVALLLVFVDRRDESPRRLGRVATEVRRSHDRSSQNQRTVTDWARLAPSELYRTSVERVGRGSLSTAAKPMSGLLLGGIALHVLGWTVYRRLLETPAVGSARSIREGRARWRRPLPGLSPAASAVAVASVRLAARTVRGKMVLFGPTLCVVAFAVMLSRGLPEVNLGLLSVRPGILLALTGGFWTLLALQPLNLNQFAADGPGLTLEFLAPISNLDLVKGKTAGIGLISVAAIAPCFVLAYVVAPGGAFGLWLAVALISAGAFLLLAPVAAILSALFPKAVDLGSLGRAGNPQSMASLIGSAVTMGAFGLPSALAFTAGVVFGRPQLILLVVAAWVLIAGCIAALLLRVAARILESRRENLAVVGTKRSGS